MELAKQIENKPTVYVPLKSLNPLPGNSRIHDERQIEVLMGSVSQYGQTRPLIVNRNTVRGKKNVVIIGNGLLESMRRLHLVDVEVKFYDLNEHDAIALSELDNRSWELGIFDFAQRKENLLELDNLNFDMGEVGFNPQELENVMTWTPEPNKHLAQGNQQEQIGQNHTATCPECGAEFKP